jgi:hypothetical protein
VKSSKVKVLQRKFKKEHSVFREWREDTDLMLKKACDIDLQQWKVPRFVKDQDDVSVFNLI